MAKKNETLVSVIALAVGAWLLGNKMKKTNESIGRTWFGGNSGYDGYSMSWRARQAREDGKYPKTDFKQVYGLTDKSFNALVRLGIIDDSEWHHTSKYGNRTTFYEWMSDTYLKAYDENKKQIDKWAREGDLESIELFFEVVDELDEDNDDVVVTDKQDYSFSDDMRKQYSDYESFLKKEKLQYIIDNGYMASNGIYLIPHEDFSYNNLMIARYNDEQMSMDKEQRNFMKKEAIKEFRDWYENLVPVTYDSWLLSN